MSKRTKKNKNHHNKTRLWRMVKGFVPALIMLVIPKIRKRIIFSSDHNVAFKHSSKYLFEYFLNNHPEYQVKFVINSNEYRRNLIKQYGDHFIKSNSLMGHFYVLRAKTWIVSSFETPVGGVCLSWGRYVHHLSHGAPLKNVGLMEHSCSKLKKAYYALIRNNFTYYYSTSEIFNEIWAKCLGVNPEQIVVQPLARNELIKKTLKAKFTEISSLVPEGRNILYAPTWRPFSETKLFNLEGFTVDKLNHYLEINKINLFLRLHPNFSENIDPKLLVSSRIQMLGNNHVHDINSILGSFDLVITDYSSIYIDFLLTLKPVMFLPYDYTEYYQKVGFSIDFDKYTPGPKPSSYENFELEIKKLLDDQNYYLEQRISVNNSLNDIKSEPSKINAEFILSKLT